MPRAQAFRAVVGRQLRFIHALDVVPSLPPLDTFSAVDYGIWIPVNETIVLEDRPSENFDSLNWYDLLILVDVLYNSVSAWNLTTHVPSTG